MASCPSCGAFVTWAESENGPVMLDDRSTVPPLNVKGQEITTAPADRYRLADDFTTAVKAPNGPWVDHRQVCVNATRAWTRKPE